MDMLKRVSLIAACFAMLFMTIGARAERWDKKTTFTFSQAVDLPGIVLPAGTYVFRLADVLGSRNVVQVLNAEENHVFATIMAVPDERVKPGAKTLLGLEEQNAGLPMAIRQWFYAGDVAGVEFVHR
jgi:hypothetical protein